MANIRNQCSWVHSNDWDNATAKAKQLTRMAVAKSAQLEPLKISEVPVNNTALIIGAGAAGLSAALILADQGFPVHIIERENILGGNLKYLQYFTSINGERTRWTPKEYLAETIFKAKQHPLITIHLNTVLTETTGFKGNFTSILNNGSSLQIQHGIIIVATGGEEYKGPEYRYGQSEKIVTQLEFEGLLSNGKSPSDLPKSVTMIQCVGPAERYCSRLCCTTALKNALKLKELDPSTDITILYRDIRTYGFKEQLYTKAREVGVRFIQFEFDRKPEVDVISLEGRGPNSPKSDVSIRVFEPILGRHILLQPDILVLSTPVVASKGTRELASILKLSIDMDGFFLEAHVKLRPVDFAADGIYMAGMAHYPKFLDETIAQAQAAASRAAIILSQKTMLTNARVAVVDPLACVGCLTCVRICPYNVPQVKQNYVGVGNIIGAAYIEPAVCHGCGSCASECPAQAIQLMCYTDAQTLTKLDALFDDTYLDNPVIPIDSIDVISKN
jgi:heterodisulfide reductase subunit A